MSELQLLGTVDVLLYSMDIFFPSSNLANFLICYYSLITPNFHKIPALDHVLFLRKLQYNEKCRVPFFREKCRVTLVL